MFDIEFTEFNTPEALAFYQVHKSTPLSELLLKYSGNKIKTAWSIQLESRRKARVKIPTWYSSEGIVFPPPLNLQQSSSEAAAQYKARLMKGHKSADLTGGSAIDSWQMATVFHEHSFVEPNTQLFNLAKHNLDVLSLKNVKFYNQKAEEFLSVNKEFFDWIYLDPSRKTEHGNKVFLLEDYQPPVLELMPSLLRQANFILVKVSPMADIGYLLEKFRPHTSEVHVLAVDNSCKEVLLILSAEKQHSPTITAVNLGVKNEMFSFNLEDEIKPCIPAYTIGKYIFEPNAAVFKAGAFQSISQQFNLPKLQRNSHLYTSDEILKNFPGKIYQVIEVAAPYKLHAIYDQVEISVRNFEATEQFIRKKTNYKDGKNFRLFATKLNNKRLFIMTRKIHD